MSENIAISKQAVRELASEVARDHVLTLLKELQQWKDQGKDIQHYILIKQQLYTKGTS